ncbi:MAG: hypothetical protein IKT59_06770 [Bacteroidales bacterium]|nr:hypothetical protein [Bacteroidales bacterium]
MRTHLLFFAACISLALGCNSEPEYQKLSVEEMPVIRAVIEDEDAVTKTSLGAGNSVLWSEYDTINVFKNSMAGSPYAIMPESVGTTSGVFKCVENKSKGVKIGADVAFYPYSSGMYCSKLGDDGYEITSFEFPSEMDYVEGTFPEGLFPMVAITEPVSEDFSFRNVSGVLKLLLKGEDAVKSLTVQGNAGEPLSGNGAVSVSFSNPVPVVSMSESAGKSVKIDCGFGVQLQPDAPTAFLIPLPPTVFENGFNVVVESQTGAHMTLNTSARAEVKRSTVLCMPEILFEPTGGVQIEAVSVTFNEILIHVKVEDAVEYSGGYALASAFTLSKVQRDANWKTVPRISDVFEYEGPLTGFPNVTPVPVSAGQTYVVWVAPYKAGQKSVAQEDIVYREFTVPGVSGGGNVEVACNEVRAELNSLEAELSAPGASVIYSALLTDAEIAKYADDAALIGYLFDKASPVSGETAVVSRTGLQPGTALNLVAVAIGSEGKYGSLMRQSVSTAVPLFDDSIQVNLSVSYEGKTAYVNVGTLPEEAYCRYFVGKKSSSTWNRMFGGTRESAESYMASNPGSYLLENTLETPLVDGCIKFEDVEMSEEYVAVVMVVTAEGLLSRAALLEFVPTMDLGNFVYKTGSQSSLWQESQPVISFGTCMEESGFYIVKWSVQPAEGMTAYTVCAHPNSIADCETPEDLAIRVYNMGVKVVPGQMETLIYGDKENSVYVTWCDAEGNFYETYSETVPQN